MNRKKLFENFLFFALLGIVVYNSVINFFRYYPKYMQLKHNLARLENKLVEEKNKLVDFDSNLSNINNDFYKEKIAREELNLIKEGEIIYRLQEEEN